MSECNLRHGKCPFKFVPLEKNDKIKNDFLGYEDGLVRSEPENWILGGRYGEDYADKIYNMPIRDDDVWIVTYPKSGTTWTQHIIWLLLNDLDFDTTVRADLRSPFIDLDQCTPIPKFKKILEEKKNETIAKDPNDPFLEVIKEELDFLNRTRLQDAEAIPTSEQRLIKSHMPFSLLPPDLLDRNKVIYVARDPRDVVVSYFHHHRLIRNHEFTGDFKAFFEYFINEEVLWSPFWQHISQAWKLRDNKNMLFLFFSDMKQDLMPVIQSLSSFLGLSYTPDQLRSLQEHVDIKNMQKNESVNDTDLMVRLGFFKENEGSFVRKGKSGGWRDYFDQEMEERINRWKEENCRKYEVPEDKLWMMK